MPERKTMGELYHTLKKLDADEIRLALSNITDIATKSVARYNDTIISKGSKSIANDTALLCFIENVNSFLLKRYTADETLYFPGSLIFREDNEQADITHEEESVIWTNGTKLISRVIDKRPHDSKNFVKQVRHYIDGVKRILTLANAVERGRFEWLTKVENVDLRSSTGLSSEFEGDVNKAYHHALGLLFDDTYFRTPSLYKDIRDWIIKYDLRVSVPRIKEKVTLGSFNYLCDEMVTSRPMEMIDELIDLDTFTEGFKSKAKADDKCILELLDKATGYGEIARILNKDCWTENYEVPTRSITPARFFSCVDDDSSMYVVLWCDDEHGRWQYLYTEDLAVAEKQYKEVKK